MTCLWREIVSAHYAHEVLFENAGNSILSYVVMIIFCFRFAEANCILHFWFTCENDKIKFLITC